ncbi:MAG TPA: hypothetical protein VG713_20425, partial [Pirellulales bacterium]|nr:hypothetical protein [Pirellulales bacterium]
MFHRCSIVVVVLSIAVTTARAEPDEAALGKAQGYPRGNATTMFADAFKIGSFSGSDQIVAHRMVAHGDE